MAFSDAQRVQLRLCLGYPVINRYRDMRLEGAIDVIGAEPEAQAAVEAILAQIVLVDTALGGSLGTAGLKRAEEIEWYQATAGSTVGPEIASKRAEGKRHVGRLSILMGIPKWGDYFGEGGYPGDNYMGVGHQYGGPLKLG